VAEHATIATRSSRSSAEGITPFATTGATPFALKRTLLAPSIDGAEAGAGAILVAYRLAGLPALAFDYAVGGTGAQSECRHVRPLAAPTGPNVWSFQLELDPFHW
jgi:hypothetical protein